MQVILLQKVHNLGDLGDHVRVRSGYGRNYLVPKGIALVATPANIAVFGERKAEYLAASTDRITRAKGRVETFVGKSFTLPMRASDEGRLYGSVGPKAIAQAVSEAGCELDATEVSLPGGVIRQVGYYTAILHLHAEVETRIEVVVAQLTDTGVNMPPRASQAEEDDQVAAPRESQADDAEDADGAEYPDFDEEYAPESDEEPPPT